MYVNIDIYGQTDYLQGGRDVELREITMYEARMNDLPATEPGDGQISIWYALEDEGSYKGFMEIIQEGELSEISFFMIPDIYQGNGYGRIMLKLFLDEYIPQSKPESMLTTLFEYSGEYGDAFTDLFSDYGFNIGLRSFRECMLPFEMVYKRLASRKASNYNGSMMNLSECINEVLDGVRASEDDSVTIRDVRNADLELSVAALDSEGKLEALLLASEGIDRKEIEVSNLYTATDDPSIIRRFLAFAVENAGRSSEPPQYISFVAANEKLERVMDTFFDNPKTSKLVLAEAEFDLGKYIEQLKLLDSLRR